MGSQIYTSVGCCFCPLQKCRGELGDMEVMRLIDTWNDLSQSIVDDAVDEWRKTLQACVNEKGGHFEHLL